MVDEAALKAVADAVDPAEVVRFARALIAAPSENPGGNEEEAAAAAAIILTSLGAEPRTLRSEAGRPNVVGSIGSGGRPKLAWNGHLDVVPAGAVDSWRHSPWDGTIEDGRLIGRGAADMKGPIAAALAACAAIGRAGVDLAGTLDLHLAADEEVGGLHGTKVLWERGLLDQDACIVGEPSELRIGLAQRGGAWITATAFGTAAHGSQPHLGVNAITSMARFLTRLPEALPDLEHPLAGRPSVNAAIIEGGSAPNVVPDRCTVDIDRRIVPGEIDREAVIGPFLRLAVAVSAEHPEVRIDTVIREWTDAAEAPEDSPIANLARGALEAEGRPADDAGFTGITDARFYINEANIPTVILGPGSLSAAHTANESIDLEELAAGARIYARIFAACLGR